MRNRKLIMLLSCLTMGTINLSAQSTGNLRLNQVGVYPGQEKIVVVEGNSGKLTVKNASGKKAGKVKVLRTSKSPWSGKTRTVVSISGLSQPGTYTVEAGGDKATLTVKPNALREVAAAGLKAFYYQRTAMPIEAQYAGKWSRPAGHMDNHVMIHASATSPGRPEGTIILSPKGWYDAGDYNKYIVNSAYSIALMLLSYEQNKAYYDALDVNIPESRNKTADLLDELMYNLEWMLTMQDPWDGGVYHKLTTPNFEGFIMPGECKQQRYVVQKSVTASYDFAAVMAQAARIYEGNTDYSWFSAHAKSAALAAYHWAEEHPEALYNQDAMNRKYNPDVNTGTYGDMSAYDERFWAATELFLLTGDSVFQNDAACNRPNRFSLPTWGQVATLGTYEWAMKRPQTELGASGREQMIAYCDSIIKTTPTSCYQSPSGNSPRDFFWGCLSETFGTSSMTLLFAHAMTGDARYLTAALQNADYLMGRNATGYCYVTGFGQKSPMHPHHRLSAADGIEAPIPGLLAGGPNPGQQDRAGGLTYPSRQPDESYLDEEQSYASNEIAINWNAALVAMMGWIDAQAN